MDLDGSVKPVPIHIRTDDDLDMFLAMRVDLRDLKLYVVPKAKGMTLDVEDYHVVKATHGFASAETVRGSEYDREKALLADCYNGGMLLLTQKATEIGESKKPRENMDAVYGPVDDHVDLRVSIDPVISADGTSGSVFPDSSSSTEETASCGMKRLTKNLLPLFESEGTARHTATPEQNQGRTAEPDGNGKGPMQPPGM